MKAIPQRLEAISAGLKHYNTGAPCARGHTCDRLVSTNGCLECTNMARAKWRAEHPERDREITRKSKAKHNHGYNAKARVRMRNYYREKKGIPEPPYPPPVNCELCGEPLEQGKGMHLDHDHVTGKFRGWLHNRCNMGIGLLGDNIAGLKKALAYLERTST